MASCLNRPVTPSKCRNKQTPPGGSNFGGNFQKKAFAAYVFPKDGSTRLQMRDFEEAKGANLGGGPGELMHTVACQFHSVKEAEKPSKLRKEFEYARAHPPKQPGWEARCEAQLRASASSPQLGAQATPFSAPAQMTQGGVDEPEMAATSPAEPPPTGLGRFMTMYTAKEVTADMLNPSSNPHPCLTRGFLKLSKGRARDWGVDLAQAPGYHCPMYEAPQDRMAIRREDPMAEPRVHGKSKKWGSEESWSNPENHASFKVGQLDGTGYNPAPGDSMRGSNMRRARTALQLKVDFDTNKPPEA
mmetsp:Transcript_6555/g.17581  ORF Transcript_6555/g.17581 Transcript_6555/m.17581 type:complete len:302 (-) Transcript_6555:97-1002(-)